MFSLAGADADALGRCMLFEGLVAVGITYLRVRRELRMPAGKAAKQIRV